MKYFNPIIIFIYLLYSNNTSSQTAMEFSFNGKNYSITRGDKLTLGFGTNSDGSFASIDKEIVLKSSTSSGSGSYRSSSSSEIRDGSRSYLPPLYKESVVTVKKVKYNKRLSLYSVYIIVPEGTYDLRLEIGIKNKEIVGINGEMIQNTEEKVISTEKQNIENSTSKQTSSTNITVVAPQKHEDKKQQHYFYNYTEGLFFIPFKGKSKDQAPARLLGGGVENVNGIYFSNVAFLGLGLGYSLFKDKPDPNNPLENYRPDSLNKRNYQIFTIGLHNNYTFLKNKRVSPIINIYGKISPIIQSDFAYKSPVVFDIGGSLGLRVNLPKGFDLGLNVGISAQFFEKITVDKTGYAPGFTTNSGKYNAQYVFIGLTLGYRTLLGKK